MAKTTASRGRFDGYMKELDELKATSISDYAPILGKVYQERSSLGLGYTGVLLIRIEEEVRDLLKKG